MVTLMPSPTTVSDGSNGVHDTVTGSVTATLPDRLAVPRVTVMACADAAVAPDTASSAASGRSFRTIESHAPRDEGSTGRGLWTQSTRARVLQTAALMRRHLLGCGARHTRWIGGPGYASVVVRTVAHAPNEALTFDNNENHSESPGAPAP